MATITNINTVVLPAHLYAHTETRINDNSIRTYSRSNDGNCKVLAVLMSPKGRDGVITTINGLEEFDDVFGVGPYSIYGQPLINARASAYTNCATLQVLRVTAKDATYANTTVFLRYKVVAPEAGAEGKIPEGAKNTMKVKFVTTHANIDNLDKLASSAVEPEEEEGWTTVRVMSVAYVGKGKCGDNISFRITNFPRADKTNAYKNYYFSIFENTTLKEEYKVSFTPDAIVNSNSIYAENVINKFGSNGSDQVIIDYNENFVPVMYAAYKSHIDPKTTLSEQEFDPFLGINKNLASVSSSYFASPDSRITGYEIVDDADQGTVQLNTVFGIELKGGSDGAFDIANDATARTAAINKRYVEAFSGEIDRNILSKYRCPLDVAFDADYEYNEVKKALAALCSRRNEDFMVYFDLNTDITTREEGYLNAAGLDNYVNYWTMSIDAYYGKIKDPYNQKVITVTSTYNLSINLPYHWKKYGGKHIPYAGSKYGVIDNYIKDTIYPVYDDSVDQEILDKFVDAHVNFAKIDAKGNVIRGSQTTRYSGLANAFASNADSYTVSNLSEENNCHVVLDIKKDAEKLVANYSYNFNEISDLNLFNREMEAVTDKYAAAQVKSISAQFTRTDEEAELGVLHLYIAVQHKALVKYIQIDIDVNRNVNAA